MFTEQHCLWDSLPRALGLKGGEEGMLGCLGLSFAQESVFLSFRKPLKAFKCSRVRKHFGKPLKPLDVAGRKPNLKRQSQTNEKGGQHSAMWFWKKKKKTVVGMY